MPSGTVTLVVPLDAPLTVTDGGSGPTAYGSVLAGLSTTPAHIHHDGNQHGVQLALRPGAVRALFGVRAAEVAGGAYELVDVMGPTATTLRERLHETDSWATRFALVEQVLLDLERDRRARHRAGAGGGGGLAVDPSQRGAAPIRDVAASRRLVDAAAADPVRRGVRRDPQGARPGAAVRALPAARRGRGRVARATSRRAAAGPTTPTWTVTGAELAGTSPTRWRTDDVLIGA